MNRRSFIKRLAAGVFIASISPTQLLVGEETCEIFKEPLPGIFYVVCLKSAKIETIVEYKDIGTPQRYTFDPLGSISLWHGNPEKLPVSYALCNGARINRLRYPEAHKKMDGKVPDLRNYPVSPSVIRANLKLEPEINHV